jgi:hypothetical protein
MNITITALLLLLVLVIFTTIIMRVFKKDEKQKPKQPTSTHPLSALRLREIEVRIVSSSDPGKPHGESVCPKLGEIVLYSTQGSQRVIYVQIHGIRPIGLGDPGKHLGDTPFFWSLDSAAKLHNGYDTGKVTGFSSQEWYISHNL